jgi:hypothetical protein
MNAFAGQVALEGLIERLHLMFARADCTSPGPFQFISSVQTENGNCTCVIVLARDAPAAREAAAKALTG